MADLETYRRLYRDMPAYAMGNVRMQDALADLDKMLPGHTYLDVGCGRGEMVRAAYDRGLVAMGLEQVPELCDGMAVIWGSALATPWPDQAMHYVTCFDVLEHLPPGDEAVVLHELRRVARWRVVVTANNKPSRCPTTGTNLHINIRSYDEWHQIIEDVFLPADWRVHRHVDKNYVSETWTMDSPLSPHQPEV